MAVGIKHPKHTLDDERCFSLYRDTGSVYKVAKILASEGLVNEETGRPFTPMGIWTAGYRWAIANKKEAKEIILQSGRVNGTLFSEEELNEILDDKAKYIHARSKRGLAKYLSDE